MRTELIDREEQFTYKGMLYELRLAWDRDALGRCIGQMPPSSCGIICNGKVFATIDCYSYLTGFTIEGMHPENLFKRIWKVTFPTEDINSFPFLEILKKLPI